MHTNGNTPKTNEVDVTVIGGGIVGLATSYAFLKRYPNYKLLLVEKENQVGMHQTGHNSGVIHSGIYYQPGSLKAKLCVDGAKAMIQFAQENKIPYEICGKIILATQEREIPWLRTLYERGIQNGVGGLELIEPKRIKELEPHATGLLGIYLPGTGIIHYGQTASILERKIRAFGGELQLGCEVTEIRRKDRFWQFNTSKGSFRSRYLINCAGLYSDRIAQLAGVKPSVSIIPFRGEYYLLKPGSSSLIRNLIYPLPQPDLPFLGVHFTRTIDQKFETGPNAVLALGREAYRRDQYEFRDLWEMATNKGFWNLIKKYWKTGIFESYRALSKASFVRELQRMVPDVTENDLMEGPTGIRAQAVDSNGNLVNDFKIMESQDSIHVLNVPSPAATASLTIGDHIVKLAAQSFLLAN